MMILYLLQLSVKHDTARVVQCCLKYGSRDQRTSLFNELKGNTRDDYRDFKENLLSFSFTDHVVELSKLKYAKFTVKSLMKYW